MEAINLLHGHFISSTNFSVFSYNRNILIYMYEHSTAKDDIIL